MSKGFSGRLVAVAETRQLDELCQMLEREGATVFRCPMVSILDSPDEIAVQAWIDELISGRFSHVVFFTGEGVRRLRGFAERRGRHDAFVAALGRTKIVARGPKPIRALKEIGLTPFKVAGAPTTEGIIATLKTELQPGQTVGVQLYREKNPELDEYFAASGCRMMSVLPYIYAPASDADRVDELIQKLSQSGVDVLILTSSPQVDRLYEVAAERNRTSDLVAGLQKTRVAAVGPVVAESLRRRGAPVHICPEQGFVLKNLLKRIRDDLAARSS